MFFLSDARAEGSVRSGSKDLLLAAVSATSTPTTAPGMAPMSCAALPKLDKSDAASRRNACAIAVPTAAPRSPPTKVAFSTRRTKIDCSFVKRTVYSLRPEPLQTSSFGMKATVSSKKPFPQPATGIERSVLSPCHVGRGGAGGALVAYPAAGKRQLSSRASHPRAYVCSDAHLDDGTGSLVFDRIPTRIVVRPGLSKVGHTYFFFLGPEAVGYLDGYVRDRVGAGERLTPASALITLAPERLGLYRERGKQFISTRNIADFIRKPMRAAGVHDLTPYAWRAYYSSRTMLCRDLTIEMRDFLQGHKGGIAQVYSTNRELPPDIVEAMRRAYASALPYLETTGQPVNPRLEALKALLLPFGYSDKELSGSGVDDLLAMIEKEVQRLQAQVMVPTIRGVERPMQRVVPNSDLPKLFEAGWTFKASLGDGQSIVEGPAGSSAPSPCYPPSLHRGMPLARFRGPATWRRGAVGPALIPSGSGTLTTAHSQDRDGPLKFEPLIGLAAIRHSVRLWRPSKVCIDQLTQSWVPQGEPGLRGPSVIDGGTLPRPAWFDDCEDAPRTRASRA